MTRDWKSESVTYLLTYRRTMVGAWDTCVSKKVSLQLCPSCFASSEIENQSKFFHKTGFGRPHRLTSPLQLQKKAAIKGGWVGGEHFSILAKDWHPPRKWWDCHAQVQLGKEDMRSKNLYLQKILQNCFPIFIAMSIYVKLFSNLNVNLCITYFDFFFGGNIFAQQTWFPWVS